MESQNLTRPFRDEPDHPTQLEYVKECLRAFGIDFLQYDATRGELEGLKDAKKLPVEFE